MGPPLPFWGVVLLGCVGAEAAEIVRIAHGETNPKCFPTKRAVNAWGYAGDACAACPAGVVDIPTEPTPDTPLRIPTTLEGYGDLIGTAPTSITDLIECTSFYTPAECASAISSGTSKELMRYLLFTGLPEDRTLPGAAQGMFGYSAAGGSPAGRLTDLLSDEDGNNITNGNSTNGTACVSPRWDNAEEDVYGLPECPLDKMRDTADVQVSVDATAHARSCSADWATIGIPSPAQTTGAGSFPLSSVEIYSGIPSITVEVVDTGGASLMGLAMPAAGGGSPGGRSGGSPTVSPAVFTGTASEVMAQMKPVSLQFAAGGNSSEVVILISDATKGTTLKEYTLRIPVAVTFAPPPALRIAERSAGGTPMSECLPAANHIVVANFTPCDGGVGCAEFVQLSPVPPPPTGGAVDSSNSTVDMQALALCLRDHEAEACAALLGGIPADEIRFVFVVGEDAGGAAAAASTTPTGNSTGFPECTGSEETLELTGHGENRSDEDAPGFPIECDASPRHTAELQIAVLLDSSRPACGGSFARLHVAPDALVAGVEFSPSGSFTGYLEVASGPASRGTSHPLSAKVELLGASGGVLEAHSTGEVSDARDIGRKLRGIHFSTPMGLAVSARFSVSLGGPGNPCGQDGPNCLLATFRIKVTGGGSTGGGSGTDTPTDPPTQAPFSRVLKIAGSDSGDSSHLTRIPTCLPASLTQFEVFNGSAGRGWCGGRGVACPIVADPGDASSVVVLPAGGSVPTAAAMFPAAVDASGVDVEAIAECLRVFSSADCSGAPVSGEPLFRAVFLTPPKGWRGANQCGTGGGGEGGPAVGWGFDIPDCDAAAPLVAGASVGRHPPVQHQVVVALEPPCPGDAWGVLYADSTNLSVVGGALVGLRGCTATAVSVVLTVSVQGGAELYRVEGGCAKISEMSGLRSIVLPTLSIDAVVVELRDQGAASAPITSVLTVEVPKGATLVPATPAPDTPAPTVAAPPTEAPTTAPGPPTDAPRTNAPPVNETLSPQTEKRQSLLLYGKTGTDLVLPTQAEGQALLEKLLGVLNQVAELAAALSGVYGTAACRIPVSRRRGGIQPEDYASSNCVYLNTRARVVSILADSTTVESVIIYDLQFETKASLDNTKRAGLIETIQKAVISVEGQTLGFESAEEQVVPNSATFVLSFAPIDKGQVSRQVPSMVNALYDGLTHSIAPYYIGATHICTGVDKVSNGDLSDSSRCLIVGQLGVMSRPFQPIWGLVVTVIRSDKEEAEVQRALVELGASPGTELEALGFTGIHLHQPSLEKAIPDTAGPPSTPNPTGLRVVTPSPDDGASTTTAIIVIAVLCGVSLVAIGAYFFVKKGKSKSPRGGDAAGGGGGGALGGGVASSMPSEEIELEETVARDELEMSATHVSGDDAVAVTIPEGGAKAEEIAAKQSGKPDQEHV